MKCAVAILTVALASQCLANPVGDVYSDLIVDVLTYAKQQLQAHDPLSLPDIKNEKIVDQNVNLVVSQTNTKLSKASTFTVEEVSTDPATLTATVRVKIPEFLQTGDYVISGESYNRNVSGQGTISVAFVNFDQLMSVTVVNPDTSLQISSLDLKYNVSSVNVAETGLNIEGMTQAETAVFMEKTFTAMILNQRQQVEKLTAAVLEGKLNSLLAGKTLQEVAAWVKSLIQQ